MAWLDWIVERIKEPTTWGAIISAVGAAGIPFDWGLISGALVAVGTAMSAATKERK